MSTPLTALDNDQRSLFGVRLSRAQKIALFLLLSTLIAGFTAWLRPLLGDIGPVGYAVAFILSALGSASVVIPVPIFAALIVLAKDFDPILVGIAAGFGGNLGELTGYWLGTQCQIPLEGSRIERFMSRAMGRFVGDVVFGAALLPIIPLDVAGLIAGASGYPKKSSSCTWH